MPADAMSYERELARSVDAVGEGGPLTEAVFKAWHASRADTPIAFEQLRCPDCGSPGSAMEADWDKGMWSLTCSCGEEFFESDPPAEYDVMDEADSLYERSMDR